MTDLTALIKNHPDTTINVKLGDLIVMADYLLDKHSKDIKYKVSNPEELERLFTRKETAVNFGISLPTLWEYTKNGIIKAVRIGSSIRYRQRDLEEALKNVLVK